jgi:hypothetical protein
MRLMFCHVTYWFLHCDTNGWASSQDGWSKIVGEPMPIGY